MFQTSYERMLLLSLAKEAYYKSETPITLSSGVKTSEYINCQRALCYPSVMERVGKVMLDAIQLDQSDKYTHAVGGMTMGSDPIAFSTSRESYARDWNFAWFSIRKTQKDHGNTAMIEGFQKDGAKVVIVDDVITSGESVIEAYEACKSCGMIPIQIIGLIERSEFDGIANIKVHISKSPPKECDPTTYHPSVNCIFTIDEIREAYNSIGSMYKNENNR